MRASRSESDSALLPFFGLAYAVSWTLWLPAVAASVGWIDPVPSRYLHLAGGLGPMVAAVIVTFWANGPEGLRQLAKQCRREAGGSSSRS
jgi:CAAX protease family protein